MTVDKDFDDDLSNKRICHACIEEEFLKSEVRQKGVAADCSYCEKKLNTFSIDDVASYIEKAFEQHYVRTPDQPTHWQQSLLADRESDYVWERDGDEVTYAIEDAAKIPLEAAEDIQQILEDKYADIEADQMGEETEFSAESYYEQKGPNGYEWQEKWNYFQRSLKEEARFFSKVASVHLAEIFQGIDKAITIDNRPLVVTAGPDTKFSEVFRARTFQSEKHLLEAIGRPDQHLGPPPSKLAVAGRMNAAGISVFYGASNPTVAIAEVRPPVGSWVAVARFKIIRELRLLDLTALSGIVEDGSIFDSTYAYRIERASFLRTLSNRLSRPIMPDDEVLEYLPTQAISDFLSTENAPLLDGIIFPAVQSGKEGLNVIIFHKSAKVEALDLPKGCEINTYRRSGSEDDLGADFSVYEEVEEEESAKKTEEVISNMHPLLEILNSPDNYDPRESSLRVDLGSIEVHTIMGVHFEIFTHAVTRHRIYRRDLDF